MIESADDLKALSTYVNAGNNCANKTFKQTIGNLTVNTTENFAGLFGHVGSGGTVTGVRLENAAITGTEYVGGIVGRNNSGTISNCIVSDSALTSAEKEGVTYLHTGGIAGYNTEHLIDSDCFVIKASITADESTNESDLDAVIGRIYFGNDNGYYYNSVKNVDNVSTPLGGIGYPHGTNNTK